MTDKRAPISKLRRQILTRQGVQPEPKTKRMLTVNEQPDLFHKTDKMKVLELRFHVKIENIIFKGSLLDVVQFFKGEVDKTTVSKWRKSIQEQIGRVYMKEGKHD